MGEYIEDVIQGLCCSWCNTYFTKAHNYPVLCNSCWEIYSNIDSELFGDKYIVLQRASNTEVWTLKLLEYVKENFDESINMDLLKKLLENPSADKIIIKFLDNQKTDVIPKAYLSDISWSDRHREYEILLSYEDLKEAL